MTSPSAEPFPAGADRSVAVVAVVARCRNVLLGRGVVTVIAGLLVLAHPLRIVALLALVVLSTAAELGVLVRRPEMVRRTVVVLIVDSALAGAVAALNTGSSAFLVYVAGAAALAGVLLGRRAWPLWVLQAAASAVLAAVLLPASFAVVFPIVTVLAGLLAASFPAPVRPVERPVPDAVRLVEGSSLDNPDEPFDAGIERICREWSASSRTAVRVNADPVEPPPTTRSELTRILNEALRNVDQHADARRVDIWVRRAGEGVRLVIRDDGNGFSVPPDLSVLRAGNHFGVIGMAERARTIGADFIVRSAPSEGTLIEVLAPLSQPTPDSR